MMKLVVISSPGTVTDETGIINALLEEGLELFHLRKPAYSKKKVVKILDNIDSRYRSKIVLHQHHDLSEQFGISRIHFPESKRLQSEEEEFRKWKAKHFILSTSIHSMKDYHALSDSFEYAFYGPVFESISKPGYKPHSNQLEPIVSNNKTEMIAIGGITPAKIEKVKQMGFDGVAVLGAIWKDTTNAITTFKACRESINRQ